MDDYTASCSKIQNLHGACQRMRESLTCTICIELFREPVSLKCGHRFCRGCILRVTGNENSSCPLCNIKIQKRSIPRESCALIQDCIKRFKELCQAILSDSGIDVTKSLNKTQSTKESTYDKASTSKAEIFNNSRDSIAVSNIRTPSSKILSRKNPPSSRRQSVIKQKAASKTNRIEKYFSNQQDCDSEEKVKSWLENLTPDINSDVIKSETVVEVHTPGDQEITPATENLESSTAVPDPSSYISSDLTQNSNKRVSEDTGDLNYKETRTILENVETMAKKKKSPSIPENVILKTPSAVPAASHPDAQDWRRVKKVGKEMQVKTFKSLNLSVEKRCSSPTQDYDENSRDSIKKIGKSAVLEEYNSNKRNNNDKLSISQSKEKNTKSLSINKSVDENSNTKDVSKEGSKKSYNRHLLTSESDENTPDLYPDEIEGNGPAVYPLDIDNGTPEKTRDAHITNQPSTSRFNQPSPLKIGMKRNKIDIEEPSDLNSETSVVESSPVKSKPSLKLSLKNTSKSSPVGSNADKTDQLEDKTFQNSSPEKSRSRLSLRLPTSKKSEENLNSSSGSVSSCLVVPKPCILPKHSHVVFRKMGRICKKKKTVPFLYLGKLNPAKTPSVDTSIVQAVPRVLVKSNVPVRVDYKALKTDTPPYIASSSTNLKILSPGKDSQLKFLATDSFIRAESHVNETNPQSFENQVERPSSPMEIDEPPLANRESLSNLSTHQDAQPGICLDDERVDAEKAVDDKLQSCSAEEIPEAESKVQSMGSESSSELEKVVAPSMPEVLSLNSTGEIVEYQDDAQRMDDDVQTPENQVSQGNKSKRAEDDIISISSKDEECDGKVDHEVLKEKSVRKISLSSSSSSSPRITSSKKRRIPSESSMDDDDHDRVLDEFVGRWGTESEPLLKQPKTSASDPEKRNKNEISRAKDSNLNKSGSKNPKPVAEPTAVASEEDPAPVENVNKIRNPKEDGAIADKLVPMPSSLLSADLFESEAQVTPKRMKTRSASRNNQNSVILLSPSKNSDKSSLDDGPKDSDMTMVDAQQFHHEQSNLLNSSDISNKENEEINRDMMSTPIRKNSCLDQESEVADSQNAKIKRCLPPKNYESYHVSDSLMDITQEQLARKEIEKDLFGIDLSEIQSDTNAKFADPQKFKTPPRKTKESQMNNDLEDDFDSENIGATPQVKRRPKFNFPMPVDEPKSGKFGTSGNSNTSSPDYLNFSTITPLRSNLQPLNHSTPMMDTSLDIKDSKQMVLVCSCLRPDDLKKVNLFVEKFNARLQTTFTMDVTHVIFRTDPKTKSAQKTFKYIQGIGFKKYVIGFQWIEDCLKQDTILDEDDEKYDVLDPDNLVSGTKRARTAPPSLFENFVCLCIEPFESCKVDEFKELLHHNGAVVVPSWEQLDSFTGKFRVIIVGGECVDQEVIDDFKKKRIPLVHFEWVVDSLSQYHITSLLSYFVETTADEALDYGIPPEFLVEDETAEETDIDVE